MEVRLIAVPNDSARRGWRMGAGPLRLLDLGAAIDLLARAAPLLAVTLSAYDPSFDSDGRVARAAFDLAAAAVVQSAPP